MMNANNTSISSATLTLAKRIGKKIMYQVNKPQTPLSEVRANNLGITIKKVSEPLPFKNAEELAVLRQQQTQTILARLAELYPKCFNLQAKKPLKLGIHKELRQLHPEISRRGLTRALRAYIRSQDYYAVILKEKKRYDLKGKASGTVRKADITQAQVLLDVKEKVKKAKTKAKC
jgi:hypothetical protein